MKNIREKIIDCLNDALDRDREAITTMVKARTKCNEELAGHPTIVVEDADDGSITVGFVGVLNGVLASIGEKKIASRWSDVFEDGGESEFLDFCGYDD